MIEILCKVPSGFLVIPELETNEEARFHSKVHALSGIWTGNQQPATRTFNGKKLILGKVESLEQLEQAIGEGNFPVEVIGAKDQDSVFRKPAEADVIDFMPDRAIIDEEGNVTGYERPAAPNVGIYAGSIPWEYM